MSLVATAIGAKLWSRIGVRCAGLAIVLLSACTDRPGLDIGDECQLNTDCYTPLVCRLGHCRVECRAQRDCAAGLECVRDELGLGACQLPKETECALTSECPSFLVCRFGRCTNECVTNRDCPPGDVCAEEDGGGRGCRPESTIQCTLNSDCSGGLVCAPDRRCHPPCRTDWDCSDGRVCITMSTMTVCDFPRPDGGVSTDAGAPFDGGTRADATIDASTVGTDAGLPVPPPPRLAAGLKNTCAAPTGTGPRCWGSNADGEIGDRTNMDRWAPTAVYGLGEVAMLDVGEAFVCASDGASVECWGLNDNGQLGNASTAPANEPVGVMGLPSGTVEDLALGSAHACAIVASQLYCWGNNANGQLGLGVGDTAERHMATHVTGLHGVPVEVDAGSGTTCVRLDSGQLDCFGNDDFGQVGDGHVSATVSTPTLAAGLNDVLSVAVGSTHTCVVRRDGSVWCWGADITGQLGNGGGFGDSPVYAPAATDAIAGRVVQLVASSTNTCARTDSNVVYCWGDNYYGQAGQPSSVMAVFSPTPVSGVAAAQEVALGDTHMCVHTSSTSYYCVGQNSDGQLGDTTNVDKGAFTPVSWP